jgi:polyhydroxyalkanoate synthesis regulator phasin
MSIQRWAASIAAATVVVGGALTVAAVGLPNLVGAQDDPPAASTTTIEGTGGLDLGEQLGRGALRGLMGWEDGPLREVLDGLVADGTLTQGQADAVLDGLSTELEERAGEVEGHVDELRQEALATLGDALGMAPDEVASALEGGSTVGELIEQRGLDRQAVVDELTAAVVARVDAAVAEHGLPQAWADRVESHVAEAVDRLIDEEVPWGLLGQLGGGDHGLLRGFLGGR